LNQRVRFLLFDLFPEPLALLRDALEAARRRGVLVGGLTYAPVADAAFTHVVSANAEFIAERWPGEQMTLVADASEVLVVLIAPGSSELLQGLWSDSAYLACLHHSGLAAEMRLSALAASGNDRFTASAFCLPRQRASNASSRRRNTVIVQEVQCSSSRNRDRFEIRHDRRRHDRRPVRAGMAAKTPTLAGIEARDVLKLEELSRDAATSDEKRLAGAAVLHCATRTMPPSRRLCRCHNLGRARRFVPRRF